MFIFAAKNVGDDEAIVWEPCRLQSKSSLPIEEYVVLTAQCLSSQSRQLTCIGGHVKPTEKPLLLVQPLLPDPSTIVPSIQILEIGESAIHFINDVKACFPTLVVPQPTNIDSDDESDNEGASTSRTESATTKCTDESLVETQQFISRTRVKVVPNIEQLCQAYKFHSVSELQSAIRSDILSTSGGAALPEYHYLCIELPTLNPTDQQLSARPKALNCGIMFLHNSGFARQGSRPMYLHVPLLRELYAPDQDIYEEEQPHISQDSTVFSFNVKREDTAFGGGKTVEETIQNIRMRHASGTFRKLVLPTTTWPQVVAKYSGVLPQVREFYGDLRCRRFVGSMENKPTLLLINKNA